MKEKSNRTGIVQINRTRRLPAPGSVLVHEGMKVAPADSIAEMAIPGKVLILDVARALGVSVDESQAYFVREQRDQLQEGDIVARRGGLFSRVVRTPISGRLIENRQGKIAIEAEQSRYLLQAGLFGKVEEVIPEYGAVLSTSGHLIQGVWGNGLTGFGNLLVSEALKTSEQAEEMLGSTDVPTLLAFERCDDAKILTQIASSRAAGLILGVLAPEMVGIARMCAFPVIVMQGFGSLTQDPVLMTLLQEKSGDLACVDARVADVFQSAHPEVIIPHGSEESLKTVAAGKKIKAGDRVRVLSGQAKGLTGEVLDVSDRRTRFESGLPLEAAMILLEDENTVRVPKQNLQFIHY